MSDAGCGSSGAPSNPNVTRITGYTAQNRGSPFMSMTFTYMTTFAIESISVLFHLSQHSGQFFKYFQSQFFTLPSMYDFERWSLLSLNLAARINCIKMTCTLIIYLCHFSNSLICFHFPTSLLLF